MRLLTFLVVCGVAIEVDAAPLVLHQLFSSHMVLQHDADDPVWGWASPGEKITVTFENQKQSTTAAADGRDDLPSSPNEK